MLKCAARFRCYILMLISIGSSTLSAQDRVRYYYADSSRPIIETGTIQNYLGEQLILETPNGNAKVIAADAIVEIETHYETHHRDGITDYEAGRYIEALSKFLTAYDREPRAWVKREIAAWIVRCSLRQGDRLTALHYFREITLTDPLTRHWGIAPLVWSPAEIPEQQRKAVRPLLVSSRSDERLLAASLLLFDPTSGTVAQRQLNELASDTNPRISRMARAQLWRVALMKNEVTPYILQSWREQIDQLPAALRPGPQYLLARGLAQSGELRMAAAEYLKLTILYTNHDALSARATLDAAEAIERTGLTREAEMLYRELLIRFPSSPETTIAREKTGSN